jgi:hypothetical protein
LQTLEFKTAFLNPSLLGKRTRLEEERLEDVIQQWTQKQ